VRPKGYLRIQAIGSRTNGSDLNKRERTRGRPIAIGRAIAFQPKTPAPINPNRPSNDPRPLTRLPPTFGDRARTAATASRRRPVVAATRPSPTHLTILKCNRKGRESEVGVLTNAGGAPSSTHGAQQFHGGPRSTVSNSPNQQLIAPEDELYTFRTDPRSYPATTGLRRRSRGRRPQSAHAADPHTPD
jgi:hypothetical protein